MYKIISYNEVTILNDHYNYVIENPEKFANIIGLALNKQSQKKNLASLFLTTAFSFSLKDLKLFHFLNNRPDRITSILDTLAKGISFKLTHFERDDLGTNKIKYSVGNISYEKTKQLHPLLEFIKKIESTYCQNASDYSGSIPYLMILVRTIHDKQLLIERLHEDYKSFNLNIETLLKTWGTLDDSELFNNFSDELLEHFITNSNP
jgi:hypothetical protein